MSTLPSTASRWRYHSPFYALRAAHKSSSGRLDETGRQMQFPLQLSTRVREEYTRLFDQPPVERLLGLMGLLNQLAEDKAAGRSRTTPFVRACTRTIGSESTGSWRISTSTTRESSRSRSWRM